MITRIAGAFLTACCLLPAALVSAATLTVDATQPAGPFPLHWKGLADCTGNILSGGNYDRVIGALDSTLSDWRLAEDEGCLRLTYRGHRIRSLMPDTSDWTAADWNWEGVALDTLLEIMNPDRSLTVVFHLCLGYPLWLVDPAYQDTMTNESGSWQFEWLEGDARLPKFEGNEEAGLQHWSTLVTEFCNHFTASGHRIAMTIMAEPNTPSHWYHDLDNNDSTKWVAANQYYKAFVDGVNAAQGGGEIPVGGLVWTLGNLGQLHQNMAVARYWKYYCDSLTVRRDAVVYHHYWLEPENFSAVADSLADVFPGEPLWLTEWNYNFSNAIPPLLYEEFVLGARGAAGNLSFLDLDLTDPLHEVMTFFAILGKNNGYGVCHWDFGSGVDDWLYTASGHALRWLTAAGPEELTLGGMPGPVSARASSGEGAVQVLFWNTTSAAETTQLTLVFDAMREHHYELWLLDSLHTVLVPFRRASSDIDTVLQVPVPQLVDSGTTLGAVFNTSLELPGWATAWLRLDEDLAAVTDLTITMIDGAARLGWSAVDGAAGYNIYSAAAPYDDFLLRDSTAETHWTEPFGMSSGFYQITAFD